MNRFFSFFVVLICVCALIACGGDKKPHDYIERVSKKITAEKGGKIESSDGQSSIEIPAGALDGDTTITMTIYDVSGFDFTGREGEKLVSKIIDFEPDGTVFKKPVLVTMAASEDFENKTVAAAVLYTTNGEWSYSANGEYAILGRDAAGDPIMMTAAGDPIMLNDSGAMTTSAGDPIMSSAAGDPIMMASAAGDPIMNAAAGDPIMMTTGHFTAYTFIVLDPKEPEETDDDEPVEPGDDEPAEPDNEPVEPEDNEPVETDDDEPAETDDDETVDEDVTPAEPPVYSTVLCTGQTRCSDGESIIDCPVEGEDFYGQDAQFVAGKTCVVHKYSKKVEPVAAEEDGEGAGLRNILNGKSNNKNVRNGIFRDGETGETYEFILDENTGLKWVFFDEGGLHADAENKCSNLTYGGHEWRLPTVKEFLSISDHDRFASAVDESYFGTFSYWGFWASEPALPGDADTNPHWSYNADYGTLDWAGTGQYGSSTYHIACVNGEEYGKPGEYEVRSIGGKEVVFDPSTNLLWQKDSVSVKSWKAALAYCQNLDYAGYSDWRLPNKNELVTIVDYSKVDPASSFPGMTSDTLISSTFTVAYGGADNAIAVKMESGLVTEYYDAISVRCVRSSSHPLPEGRTIPYCDESRIAPCEDAATGYVWSGADVESNYLNYGNSVSWMNKAIQCRESSEGGISKWRIPTIDEVRTLLTSSETLKIGGECKVTNECFDYASEDCFEEEVCSPENETGGVMIRSSLFDYSGYLTGTLTSLQDDGYVWFVNLRNGVLERKAEDNYYTHESRCIMDPSLPDPVDFPYEDSANGLIWSAKPANKFSWYDAATYCHDLVLGGSNNWRVPTIQEVKTLVKDCPDGDCATDLIGKYSVFGEISELWTSTVSEAADTGDTVLHTFSFLTASDMTLTGYDINYKYGKVRCVRAVSEPENVSDNEFSFPFYDGDLRWSKVSDEEYYYSEDGEEYCTGLNEANYSGYSNWRLPTFAELGSLIKRDVCSNKDSFLVDTPSYGTRCSVYTFDGGYSIFGDMFTLKSSTNNYNINFAAGEAVSYEYGKVRCVSE